MMGKRLMLAVCAAWMGMAVHVQTCAQRTPDAMPPALARQVVDQTIELVETKAVYPRQQSEYDAAKTELLALLGDGSAAVDRWVLYGRIDQLLKTLDADGHSRLIPAPSGRSPQLASARQQAMPDLATLAAQTPLFMLIDTASGTVLRWTPPATTMQGQEAIQAYVKRFYDAAATRADLPQACALVVDLSEQTGGNAWPPFVAMYPLFSEDNNANWVDREGKRRRFVVRANLQAMAATPAAGRVNPLTPYATGPLAVVVGKRTASAGEMLLVALLGEERVQTFGHTSYGLSTANATHVLAEGATLVLTQQRYALGHGPVYRGGIPVMHPAGAEDPPDAIVKTAAEWAAANSPQCRAAKKTVAARD